MKPYKTLSIVFSLGLCLGFGEVKAQERGGCDLCGPASGQYQNQANGNFSATIGINSRTSGPYSLAVGNAARADGGTSLAVGSFVRANATNSIVIGCGLDNLDAKALINNQANSLIIGFYSKRPTLYVGPSSGAETTGKIGIGNITNPMAKLHIKSDANEDAGIILEPKNKNVNKAYIQLFDDKHGITVSPTEGMKINAREDKLFFDAKYVNMNGKIGINVDNNPLAKLHIKSDANEDAGIILEPKNKSVNKAYFQLFDDKHGISVSSTEGMKINAREDKLFFDAKSVNMNGRIGINVDNNPMAKLHIKSDANEDAGIILEPKNKSVNKAYFQLFDDKHGISVSSTEGMKISSREDKLFFDAKSVNMNGKIGINVDNNFSSQYDYALAVNGGILTTEVFVKEVTEWQDKVFDCDYNLLTISDLERYIKQNKHLPDVPSETEVKENGYGMVEMETILLKKIEELTLYTIELYKQLQQQQGVIDELMAK